MLDDHRALEPPDPIPNSVVKRRIADGSVGFPHVRVGHRQAPIPNPQSEQSGWGFVFAPGKTQRNGIADNEDCKGRDRPAIGYWSVSWAFSNDLFAAPAPSPSSTPLLQPLAKRFFQASSESFGAPINLWTASDLARRIKRPVSSRDVVSQSGDMASYSTEIACSGCL